MKPDVAALIAERNWLAQDWTRLRDENDALRAALLLVKDWPAIAALTDERMATIQGAMRGVEKPD